MSTQIVLGVLALRHRLRQSDRWTHQRLEEHQAGSSRLPRGYACARRSLSMGASEEVEAFERSSRDDQY